MDWPLVSILIVTYDRPDEVRRTLKALKKTVVYPSELLRWHLADDQTGGTYLDFIKRDFPDLHFTATVTERKGWGANVNKAMTFSRDTHKADFVFLCEDDYVSLRKINLEAGVALLDANSELGLIRYDGISGHRLNLELREHKTRLDKLQYLLIRGDSPHLNLYSNRPHLKHRRFHDRYGWYPENLPLGQTESHFAHRVRNKYHKRPKIACLDDGIPRAFDHVGKSRQGSEHDVTT